MERLIKNLTEQLEKVVIEHPNEVDGDTYWRGVKIGLETAIEVALNLKINKMEKSRELKRSETWNNIYEILARLDLKEITDDCMDRSIAATEIEQLFLKLLPVHSVVPQSEQLL